MGQKNNRKIVIATVIALLTIATITTIATVIGTLAVSSSSNLVAANQPQQNNTTTSNLRAFYLFNTNHDGVNETKLGIAPDAYSSETLTVNRGDTVVIHFYNVDTTDRHSFTLAGTYNVDSDLAAGQHSVIEFKATHQGVFGFFCKYHPTMTGELVVLPPPSLSPSSFKGISPS